MKIKVPKTTYAVYQNAAAILKKKLPAIAPSVPDLVRHELSERDPKMIASEFVDSKGKASKPKRKSKKRK